MRHAKDTFKIGHTGSHNRCMIANMLKSLIDHGKICTTVRKAKELRRHADRMVTLAKHGTLHSRRQARAALMIRYNTLTFKEKRAAKTGDLSSYNTDRRVVKKLFTELKERFKSRPGGYTRIVKISKQRIGDNAPLCILEYLEE